jgi:signal transduction histidine kinase
MTVRTARVISIVIALTAIAGIVVTLPAALAARDADRSAIVVVPEQRRAEIEHAIAEGDGCPSPENDPALADAIAVYCDLQSRSAPFATVTIIDPFAVVSFVVGLLWVATGFLIVSRRGSNLAGWTFEAVGLGLILNTTALTLTYVGTVVRPGSVPALGVWAVVGEYAFLVIALLPMLWLLFPDGTPPTPRWRTLVRVYVAAFALAIAVVVLMPGPLNNLVEFGIVYMNPLGQPWLAELGGALLAIAVLTVLGIAVASVFASRRRFAMAEGEERQQLRWLRFVISIAVVLFLLDFVGGLVVGLIVGDGSATVDTVFGVVLALLALTLALGLPAAYLVAIFRYGLWDLDVVIRKALIVAVVGVTLTAIAFGLLVFLPVVVIGIGGSARIGDIMPVLVGLLLGLVFGPVRRRARRFADRIVYGTRATPYEVLTSFGERLSGTYAADDVLPRTAQVLAQAVGASASAIWLRVGTRLRPEAVWPPDAPVPDELSIVGDELPTGPDAVAVRHQGDLLGALTVEMPANDPLDPARRQLMDDLAAQAGLVLRNARLIEELRASRQRLVVAQDEERRKLERNIHDGVQQQLVALSVQLRLAEQLAARDTIRAQEVLRGLQTQATDALEDLRDLARGIYPPLLADKGLGPALEAQARKAVVPTTVATDGIGRYPREVESTVYFCALEAMNNVAKYADATAARITLEQRDRELVFAVRDDGRGFDVGGATAGTGLQGIADRLDAVGGRIQIESVPGGGTSVGGRVPVPSG